MYFIKLNNQKDGVALVCKKPDASKFNADVFVGTLPKETEVTIAEFDNHKLVIQVSPIENISFLEPVVSQLDAWGAEPKAMTQNAYDSIQWS